MLRLISPLKRNVATTVSRSYFSNSTYGSSIVTASLATHHRGCLCCKVNSVTSFGCYRGRSLYTDVALGIESLNRMHERKAQLFSGSSKDRYLERLETFFREGKVNSIIKDDLINLIGLAETDEHLDLLEKVVQATKHQLEINDGWGTSVMRLYYKLGKLDRAYQNMKDMDRFGSFFMHRSSCKILMTMLYDAGEYDKVLDIFTLSEEKLNQKGKSDGGTSFVSNELCMITLAALAKVNNKEAFEKAQKLYDELVENTDRRPGLRPTAFLAYLSIKNDDPIKALNLISSMKASGYISLREMKIISLIELERYEDVLLQLRAFSTTIRRDSTILLRSTLNSVEAIIDQISDSNLREELNDLLAEFKKGGHISDISLEDLVFKPIENERPRFRFEKDKSFGSRNEYGSGGNYGMDRYNDRYRGGYGSGMRQRYHSDRDRERDPHQRPGEETRRRFTYQNVNFE